MSVLSVGDPITYVIVEANAPPSTEELVHGLRRDFVDGGHDKIPPPNEVVFWLYGNGTPVLWVEAEGLRWIRGHHYSNSLEGQALLAAYKLVRSAA